MNRYPSESVARMDQQFTESEHERNDRLRKKRLAQFARECRKNAGLPNDPMPDDVNEVIK